MNGKRQRETIAHRAHHKWMKWIFVAKRWKKKEELKSSQIEKTKDEYICITVRQSNSKIIYLIQMNWLWCLLLCAQKEKWIFWIKSEKSHWFNEAFLYARSRTYSIFFLFGFYFVVPSSLHSIQRIFRNSNQFIHHDDYSLFCCVYIFFEFFFLFLFFCLVDERRTFFFFVCFGITLICKITIFNGNDQN